MGFRQLPFQIGYTLLKVAFHAAHDCLFHTGVVWVTR
jgi:hypothetical protein